MRRRCTSLDGYQEDSKQASCRTSLPICVDYVGSITAFLLVSKILVAKWSVGPVGILNKFTLNCCLDPKEASWQQDVNLIGGWGPGDAQCKAKLATFSHSPITFNWIRLALRCTRQRMDILAAPATLLLPCFCGIGCNLSFSYSWNSCLLAGAAYKVALLVHSIAATFNQKVLQNRRETSYFWGAKQPNDTGTISHWYCQLRQLTAHVNAAQIWCSTIWCDNTVLISFMTAYTNVFAGTVGRKRRKNC